MHINDDDMAAWIVRNKEGKVVGGLFAQMHETFFGTTRVAYENSFYVLPEYRGSSAAVRRPMPRRDVRDRPR